MWYCVNVTLGAGINVKRDTLLIFPLHFHKSKQKTQEIMNDKKKRKTRVQTYFSQNQHPDWAGQCKYFYLNSFAHLKTSTRDHVVWHLLILSAQTVMSRLRMGGVHHDGKEDLYGWDFRPSSFQFEAFVPLNAPWLLISW